MHGKDWRTGSSKQVWGGHQGSRRQECFSGLTGRWCWNKGAFSGVSCFVPFLVKFKVLSSAGLACILGSIPGTCTDHPSRANYYWRISDSPEGHQGLLSQKSVCVCVCWERKEVDARQPNGRTTVLLGFPGKLPVLCCPDVILTEGTFILQSVLVWRINYGVIK